MPCEAPRRLRLSPRAMGAVVAFVGSGVLVLSALLPMPFHGPPACLFKGVLGFDCPSCGMTRAFVSLGHLDFASALRHNPVSLLLMAILLLAIPLSVAQALTGRDVLGTVWTRARHVMAPAIVAPLMVLWIWKTIALL